MYPADLEDIADWPHDLRLHTAALLADRIRADDICVGMESEDAVLLRRVLDTFAADDRDVAPLRPIAALLTSDDREAYVRHARAAIDTIWRRDLLPVPASYGEYRVRMEALAALPWFGSEARSCPVGWLPLMERAASQAENCLDEGALAAVRTAQIKEKFGTLRWYLHGINGRLRAIVDLAEATSRITCLACGAPGEWRRDLLWILTLCDRDYVEACDDASSSVGSRAYPRGASDFGAV